MKLTKKQLALMSGVVVVLVFGALSLLAYHRTLPIVQPTLVMPNVPTAGAAAVQAPAGAVVWSPYGEQAMTVVGKGLSADNGHASPLPTASIAKVMTALAILQKKPLASGQQGPNMPITAADVAVYQQELAQNESVVQVAEGEQFSEYQALEAMLVPSATNVADSAAIWAFGSIGNYLMFANQYAQQLGLTHTHFADDASGFSPSTVSTPQDLVLLGQIALQNPVIAQIVSQPSVTLPVAGTLKNFDIDLGQAGIIGIKTGNTDQAGGAFLFGAKYQSLTIVGAIMGAPDLGTALHDAPELLSSLEAHINVDTPVQKGQTVATYYLPWGGSVDGVASRQLSVVTWQNSTQPGRQTTVAAFKPGVAKKGGRLGAIQISYNGSTQTAPIVLKSTVPQPSFWWRLTHF